MAAPCDQHLLVGGHFGAGLSPDLERVLRAHLPTCASCRDLYDRHLLLARLDPSKLPPVDRVGRGLGIDPRPRPHPPWLTPSWRTGLVFVAIALVVVLGPFRPRQLDEFLARGGASPSDVDVKMVWVGAPPDGGDGISIPPDAELAFAYANRSNRGYLMLFSIDDREHVAWYYPAWTDPNTNPLAIPIERTTTMKELPEAVRQHYDGLQIHVMALFLTSPLSVTEVEQNISDSPDNRPHIRGALAWESDLRIRRP